MKRRTKAQKCKDLGNAIIQMRKGERVRRVGARDGSIPTHPVVPVDPSKSENEVQSECLTWLKKHHVYCKRCDAGTFQNQYGQWGSYGIIGGGDIQGILKQHDGKAFDIECKKGAGGRLNKAQQRRKRDVEYSNGLYFIVHGIEELIYYMSEWM